MHWESLRFGQVYQDGTPLHVPHNPIAAGDFPIYFLHSDISIMDNENDNAITWIKPEGMNIFVADRAVVRFMSWDELNFQGFVKGRKVSINGWKYLCRLLRTITTDGMNEWDTIVNATTSANYLWHWKAMLFWESGVSSSASNRQVVRGGISAQHTDTFASDMEENVIGFRPVLEPSAFETTVSNCTLEGQDFELNSICDSTHFLPTLQPVKKDIFADIPNGSKIHMYTFLKNGKPVHTDTQSKFRDKRQLKLTDHYFGDEYLVPWTISNGIAISDRSLQLN